MSELPTNWTPTTLGELVNYGATQKVEPSAIRDDEWVLELEDIEKNTSKVVQKLYFRDRRSKSAKNRFGPGDVLYGKLRPNLNKVVLAEEPGVCTTEIVPLRCPKGIDPGYIFYSLKRSEFIDYVTQVNHGLDMPRLGTNAGRAAAVPLPPTSEQQRIVAKIDSLSAKSKHARDDLDHIPRLVEKYKQAILTAAFGGLLTGDVHGFHRRPLETLASLITKGASPKWQGFEYVEDGTLFVRSQNVGWGKLLLDDRAYLAPEFEKKHRRSVIRRGDVLLNIVGASIGRTAVAGAELEGANCNQAVSIIRLTDKEATPNFLCYWLLSEEAQSAIAFGTVDFARANFSLGDICKLQVPWPNADQAR